MIKLLDFQNLVGGSRIRLHPQRKSYRMLVYWCFIIVCRVIWFFYDHLLASSDLHLPAPFPEERARWISWDLPKNIICVIYFCLSAISLLLGVTGNTDAYVWRSIEHVFIVFQDWTLLGTSIKVYEFVLPCIYWRFRRTHCPILMLKECFCLTFR